EHDLLPARPPPRPIPGGKPPDPNGSEASEGPAARARSELASRPQFQLLLLDLLEHLVLYGDQRAEHARLNRPAAPLLCKRLNKWLDDIRQSANGFVEAGWDERHRVRKRVKRLRYSMEFAQGTLEPTGLAPLRNALVTAQKALGQLNDLYVAAEFYRGPGAKHSSAMFALGWLAATQQHEAQASQMALQTLARAGHFKPATTGARKRKRG